MSSPASTSQVRFLQLRKATNGSSAQRMFLSAERARAPRIRGDGTGGPHNGRTPAGHRCCSLNHRIRVLATSPHRHSARDRRSDPDRRGRRSNHKSTAPAVSGIRTGSSGPVSCWDTGGSSAPATGARSRRVAAGSHRVLRELWRCPSWECLLLCEVRGPGPKVIDPGRAMPLWRPIPLRRTVGR